MRLQLVNEILPLLRIKNNVCDPSCAHARSATIHHGNQSRDLLPQAERREISGGVAEPAKLGHVRGSIDAVERGCRWIYRRNPLTEPLEDRVRSRESAPCATPAEVICGARR